MSGIYQSIGNDLQWVLELWLKPALVAKKILLSHYDDMRR